MSKRSSVEPLEQGDGHQEDVRLKVGKASFSFLRMTLENLSFEGNSKDLVRLLCAFLIAALLFLIAVIAVLR